MIGVLDLARGRAVHAAGGRRDRYRPVTRVAGVSVDDGDPRAVACAYRDRLGLSELYVADLDAIAGGRRQDALLTGLTATGSDLWLDAGISSVDGALDAIDRCARVVVGLETLRSLDALAAICREVGGERTAFSLDLREGRPLTDLHDRAAGSPLELVREAADAGAGAIIVIDLARVGSAGGPDVGLIDDVRAAVPDLMLLAGGGIRHASDLARLADAGCDGVLLATALLRGDIVAADIAAARAAGQEKR